MSEHFAVQMLKDVKMVTRDGVHLSADLYLPRATGPFPAILIRTPYNGGIDVYINKARRIAERGYACVVQDCRGRFDSEGTYYPFVAEAEDGYDAQEWIGQQSWCN